MSIDHQNSAPPGGGGGGVTSTRRSLLVGLRDGEGEAWTRLVKLYTPLVYHWCQKYDLRPDDIPDVIQEVFLSVSEHLERFRKERAQDTFRGWLRVITRNKAIDLHRRLSREVRGEGGTEALRRLEAIPAPGVAAPVDRDSTGEIGDSTEDGDGTGGDDGAQSLLFRQALGLIQKDFREPTWKAFWKVVVDGRPPADVADELGMSAGAVRVAKCRVLQRLRLELGDRDPEIEERNRTGSAAE